MVQVYITGIFLNGELMGLHGHLLKVTSTFELQTATEVYIIYFLKMYIFLQVHYAEVNIEKDNYVIVRASASTNIMKHYKLDLYSFSQ